MTGDRWLTVIGQVLLLVGLVWSLVTLHLRLTRVESALVLMQDQIIRLQLGERLR